MFSGLAVAGVCYPLTEGVAPIIAVGMGVMSATFGGLIRDTLLGRETVALGPEIYVTAALAGSLSYAILRQFLEIDNVPALLLAMLPAFVLRAGAIVRGWRLPTYRRLGES